MNGRGEGGEREKRGKDARQTAARKGTGYGEAKRERRRGMKREAAVHWIIDE